MAKSSPNIGGPTNEYITRRDIKIQYTDENGNAAGTPFQCNMKWWSGEIGWSKFYIRHCDSEIGWNPPTGHRCECHRYGGMHWLIAIVQNSAYPRLKIPPQRTPVLHAITTSYRVQIWHRFRPICCMLDSVNILPVVKSDESPVP